MPIEKIFNSKTAKILALSGIVGVSIVGGSLLNHVMKKELAPIYKDVNGDGVKDMIVAYKVYYGREAEVINLLTGEVDENSTFTWYVDLAK